MTQSYPRLTMDGGCCAAQRAIVDRDDGSTIRGRDFVVLSDDWDGLPTSTIHLFRRIVRENRVFWFNLVNRMPRPSWRDAKKVSRVLRSSLKRSKGAGPSADPPSDRADTQPPEPYLVTPPMVPWFKRPFRRINGLSMLRTYRRMAIEHAIKDPIIFAVFPSAVDFVQRVEAPAKIYYCYDELLEYPGFNPTDWRVMEEELVDAVDALVVTSRHLERKNRPSRPLLYLPHGVDFEHFRRGQEAGGSVPRMAGIPRPIVGFFGLISDWVDLDLVASLATAFPNASFVLLGKNEVPLDALRGLKNVHCLGPVRYVELPDYARYFDIALIPFVDNKLTRAVNPLKLMEYYALGLSVLATRLPELESDGGPIRLASTHAEFRNHLREMLNADTGAERRQAVEVARNNSWERRVEQLSRFIKSLA